MTVTELVYSAAGSPLIGGKAAGVCRTCGADGIGVLFTDWVKEGFTNHDLLRDGSIVCRACLFCFEDKSELLMLKVNRPTRQKMRTYSHFVVGGEWHALTKANKRTMRELLARGPSVAVISESGQKHLVFRARVGWWQFEEVSMLADWARVESMLPVIEELMAGFSKAEIESGIYAPHRVIKFGLSRWRELSEPLKAVRYKGYRMPVFTRHALAVRWYAVGNRAEIERLLSFCTHLGKKESQGYGAVLDWTVEPWANDWSVTSPRGLMRAVPSESGLRVGFRPSYWSPENQAVCQLPKDYSDV